MSAHEQPSLSGMENVYEPPKKTIPEAIGAAGAALSKVDDFSTLLREWDTFWSHAAAAPAPATLTSLHEGMELVQEGSAKLHRALALLHMRLAVTGDSPGAQAEMFLSAFQPQRHEEDGE